MEGDNPAAVHRNTARNFNPRPPHGGRQGLSAPHAGVQEFQSTPSAWRATYDNITFRVKLDDFNPRPPHGGRRGSGRRCKPSRDFNPRPPHGGRQLVQCYELFRPLFQSTPSAWRATGKHQRSVPMSRFQSTPSAWRATQSYGSPSREAEIFQSTPSAWRATLRVSHVVGAVGISIHALRMEGD